MKNVTLSADQFLIAKARERARREKTTLNAEFRKWLERYVGLDANDIDYAAIMSRLEYARPGKTFSRDEMNER